MTWLSRLIPNGRDTLQRATKRRRRMMSLEALERRIVLSNVTVSFPTPSSPLTITGDTFNDNFSITEITAPGPDYGFVTVQSGPTHFVAGIGLVAGSTIDGSSEPFTTSSPVTSIIVQLPGTNNFDFVSLTGGGKTSTSTIKNVSITANGANLTFTANSVDNNGNLVVSDTYSTPPTPSVNAVLTASVTSSTFATLAITQTGGGPDSSAVRLGSDSIAGSVGVSLGNANSNSITLSGNTFGLTALIEGNGGPSNSNSLGNSDSVSVTSGTYKSLNVDQLLNGTNDGIAISSITISPINPTTSTVVDGVTLVPNGVSTSQGNGAYDHTAISGVTVSSPAPPPNLPLPAGIGLSNITVVQGNGSVGLPATPPPAGGVNDVASVTTSSVPGNISITQSDLASNTPWYNTATLSGDTAGGNLSISQGNAGGWVEPETTITTEGDQATVTGSTGRGSISIGQGIGSEDSATVSLSSAGGNVTIAQLDVAANLVGDTAAVTDGTVGGSLSINQGNASGDSATIDPTTVGATITVTQGNGSGDTATENSASIGDNVLITQADVADNATGDTATVEDGTIGGNITLAQGSASGDTATISGITANGGGTTAMPLVTVSITQSSGNGDTVTISGLTALFANSSIAQGTGAGNFATVEMATIGGNVTITQADLAGNSGDTAHVINVEAGTTTPGPTDVNGTVSITQGNAGGDVALVQGGFSNNIAISQGDNVQILNGSTIAVDVAEINAASVTSDVSIMQGTGTSTALDAGNYVAAIAFDYLGLISGTQASGSVTVGGDTYIDQQYANNQVFLGDVNDSFTSTWLDVFAGNGGGAYVQVSNTSVAAGALGIFGPFNINGGGEITSSLDSVSNLTVTVNPMITPVVTWVNPAEITYGTALGASQLDATASVPGSFVYTPAPGRCCPPASARHSRLRLRRTILPTTTV